MPLPSARPYNPIQSIVATGTFGFPFSFTGEMVDANELVYLRARYYHPGLGVFTGLDPVEGNAAQAMSLNRYGYVAGNVVNRIDRSGLFAESLSNWNPCQESSQRHTCVNPYTFIEVTNGSVELRSSTFGNWNIVDRYSGRVDLCNRDHIRNSNGGQPSEAWLHNIGFGQYYHLAIDDRKVEFTYSLARSSNEKFVIPYMQDGVVYFEESLFQPVAVGPDPMLAELDDLIQEVDSGNYTSLITIGVIAATAVSPWPDELAWGGVVISSMEWKTALIAAQVLAFAMTGGGGHGSHCDPYCVVRGGIAAPGSFSPGYTAVRDSSLYGFSVQYQPGIYLSDLASVGLLNKKVSYEKDTEVIMAVLPLGYMVTIMPTPQGFGAYHSTVTVWDAANGDMLEQLPPELDLAFSIVFSQHQMMNPQPG